MSLSAWSTMEVDANTNKGLCLSLSLGGHYAYVPKNQVVGLDLSFTLRPKDEPITTVHDGSRSTGDGEAEVTTVSNGSDNNHLRKKLRLTKDQSSLLEDSFKLHTTLNPAQKQGLARQLNLKPRQVEVWFQNRRARTKLKQTEIDCGVLKRCCERLSEENKRLKTELHELRSLKFPTSSSPPLCIGPPKLTMCPSCETLAGDVTGSGGSQYINFD